MQYENQAVSSQKVAYWIYPHWGGLFFVIGGIAVLVIGIFVWLFFDLSASSDRVFAFEAFAAGLVADQLFRKLIKRRLVIGPKINISFIYAWALICLYVFVAEPL